VVTCHDQHDLLATTCLGQGASKRYPFGADPIADQADRRDNGNKQDAEQNRVFDQGGSLFVLAQTLHQLQSLCHDALSRNDYAYHSLAAQCFATQQRAIGCREADFGPPPIVKTALTRELSQIIGAERWNKLKGTSNFIGCRRELGWGQSIGRGIG
jgi:hypothetical protein